MEEVGDLKNQEQSLVPSYQTIKKTITLDGSLQNDANKRRLSVKYH